MKTKPLVEQVAAACPVCKVIIPMFTVRISQYGFLGRRLCVEIEGEATDWAAHLWTHTE